eukprot:1404544-Amphidinium_carterae.1
MSGSGFHDELSRCYVLPLHALILSILCMPKASGFTQNGVCGLHLPVQRILHDRCSSNTNHRLWHRVLGEHCTFVAIVTRYELGFIAFLQKASPPRR